MTPLERSDLLTTVRATVPERKSMLFWEMHSPKEQPERARPAVPKVWEGIEELERVLVKMKRKKEAKITRRRKEEDGKKERTLTKRVCLKAQAPPVASHSMTSSPVRELTVLVMSVT